MLGPIAVATSGTESEVRGERAKSVLALLALRCGESLSSAEMIDQVWGEHPPATAANSLANIVGRLRKVLGAAAIETTDIGYRLVTPRDDIDLHRLDAVMRESAVNEAARAQALQEVLDLVRGRPFAGACSSPVLDDASRWSESLIRRAQVEALELGFALGERLNPATVAAQIENDPSNERLWALLARALHRAGDPTQALATVRLAMESLADQGLAPGPDLLQAESDVLNHQVEPSNDAPDVDGSAPTSDTVGRESELRQLLAGVNQASLGRPSLAVVEGPAGIGKSTLVQRQLRDLVAADTDWIVASLRPGSAGPLTQLAHALGMGGTEDESLYAAVVESLQERARRGSCVLTFEDVHGVAAAPRLIVDVLRALDGYQVAIIVTGRPSAEVDELRKATHDLAGQRIDLQGLTVADLAVAAPTMSENELAKLHAETQGNPLFALGLAFKAEALDDFIRVELSNAAPAGRRMADLLALHDRPMRLNLVDQLIGGEERNSVLERLTAAGIAVWNSDSELMLRHDVIGESIRRQLADDRRIDLHRELRDAVEATRAGSLVEAHHLARHALAAAGGGAVDDRRQAVSTARDAASRSKQSGDYQLAARLIEQTLTLVDGLLTPSEEIELRVEGAVAAVRAGSSGGEVFTTIAEDAMALGDGDAIATTALAWERSIHTQSVWTVRPLLRCLRRALAINRSPTATRASLLARYAAELCTEDEAEERFDHAEEALSIARSLDDPRLLAFVLRQRMVAIACLDATDDILATADELAELSGRIDDLNVRFEIAQQRTGAAVLLGDTSMGDDLQDEIGDLVRRVGGVEHRWIYVVSRSGWALLRGDIEQAEQASNDALKLGVEANQSSAAGLYHRVFAMELMRLRGELEPWLDAVPTDREGYTGLTCATYLSRHSRLDDARVSWDSSSILGVEDVPRNHMQRPSLDRLATLADDLADPELGRSVAAALTPRPFDLATSAFAHPCAQHYRGIALRAAGEFDQAIEAHDAAIAHHRRVRHPVLKLEAEAELVITLERADRAEHGDTPTSALRQRVEREADKRGIPGVMPPV